MEKIRMMTVSSPTVEEAFTQFLAAAAARGVADKTLESYKQHFKAVSKRMNITSFIHLLSKSDLESMIFQMRNDHLSDTTINSYTRTLKVFFSWCNEENLTQLNIKLYKAKETVKETYTDEELMKLLKRPAPSCSFAEFRNWTIINFLLNSGCRAATVRAIQNQDVDIVHRQITLRHTKNGKIQVIPLCSSMVVILREYMSIRAGAGNDYLFCDSFGNAFSENGLNEAIRRYNRARGVERTSIHAFRHTFARKYLVDCGGDAFTLQKLMGHSTLNMTKHYCSIFDSDIVKDFDKRSPLQQLKASKKTIKK